MYLLDLSWSFWAITNSYHYMLGLAKHYIDTFKTSLIFWRRNHLFIWTQANLSLKKYKNVRRYSNLTLSPILYSVYVVSISPFSMGGGLLQVIKSQDGILLSQVPSFWHTTELCLVCRVLPATQFIGITFVRVCFISLHFQCSNKNSNKNLILIQLAKLLRPFLQQFFSVF